MKYLSDLPEGTTKEDLAKSIPELWDKDTGRHLFDYALPQGWVDATLSELELLIPDITYSIITSSFVWLYRKGNNYGQPYPLTLNGIEILTQWALIGYGARVLILQDIKHN